MHCAHRIATTFLHRSVIATLYLCAFIRFRCRHRISSYLVRASLILYIPPRCCLPALGNGIPPSHLACYYSCQKSRVAVSRLESEFSWPLSWERHPAADGLNARSCFSSNLDDGETIRTRRPRCTSMLSHTSDVEPCNFPRKTEPLLCTWIWNLDGRTRDA